MLNEIFNKIMELISQYIFDNLSPATKKILKGLTIIFIVYIVYIIIASEKGWIKISKNQDPANKIQPDGNPFIYSEYEDRIEYHFSINKKLLCKKENHRDFIKEDKGWKLFLGSLKKDSLEYTYEITDCKRVIDNNFILPNHMYSKYDKEKEEKPFFLIRWWNKFWEYDWTYDYERNNSLHVLTYEDNFNLNLVFECQEDKIRKSDNWAFYKENNESYFLKDNKKYNIIDCDEDSDSPW